MAELEFAAGVACTLAAAAINSIGIVLQKLDINRSGLKEDSSIMLFLKRPVWVTGILFQTIILFPFFFLGIALIGVTLAQPLATAGLLVFVAGSVLVLKEKVSRREWTGVWLMIAALFMVSASGVVGDITITVLFRESFLANSIVFTGILFGLVCIGVLAVKKRGKWEVQGYGIFFGVSYAIVSIAGQFVTIGFDALLGNGADPAGWVSTMLGIAGVVLGTIFGIIFTQKAFHKSQAINVVPISNSIINVLPIIAGTYLFGQAIVFLFIFIPGIVLLIASATLLSRFQK
nr:hypothetical protein [Candidatus Sigynarchaeota archaeon]